MRHPNRHQQHFSNHNHRVTQHQQGIGYVKAQREKKHSAYDNNTQHAGNVGAVLFWIVVILGFLFFR